MLPVCALTETVLPKTTGPLKLIAPPLDETSVVNCMFLPADGLSEILLAPAAAIVLFTIMLPLRLVSVILPFAVLIPLMPLTVPIVRSPELV